MTNKETPHRGGWGRTYAAGTAFQSHYTPIYAQGRVIGKVERNTFYKSIRKNHYLRKPPAIAFDVDSLEQAEQAGAIWVEVRDRGEGTVYRAVLRYILEKGVIFNRGYGEQIYLVLEGWVKSKPGGGLQLRLWS